MFQSIEIENFRGFDHLKIEDFKRCNLFVGDNNSGKTSVLEALCCSTNEGMTISLPALNNQREYSYLWPNFWRSYFKDPENKEGFKILVHLAKDNAIEESQLYKVNLLNPTESIQVDKISNVEEKVNQDGVTIEISIFSDFIALDQSKAKPRWEPRPFQYYRKGKTEEGQYRTHLESPNVTATKFSEAGILNFITATVSYRQTRLTRLLSELIESKNLDSAIEKMKIVFPELKSIYFSKDNEIICDISLKDDIPIALLGDGFRRAILIIMSMFRIKELQFSEFILIDEVEAGLHYTALIDLWKAIHQAAKELDVQVFATTHSMECVNAFTEAYNQLYADDDSDDLRVYRIARNEKQEAIARKYDRERLNYIGQTGWDIR